MGYLRNRGTKREPEWYVRFKDIDGKWKQRHSHQPSKEKAAEMLADAEGRVKRGVQGMVDPTPEDLARKSVTVEELAKRFLGDVEGAPGYSPPRIKSIDNYRRDARSILSVRVWPTLGTMAACAVTNADVERLRDQLAGKPLELAPASIVQTLAVLSKLYNWARRAGCVDCVNPVVGTERPRVEHTIDFLSREEVAKLLAGVEDQAVLGVASWPSIVLAPMVAVAVYCGLRKGELFGLTWADVHLDAGRLDVNRSYAVRPKSGKPRHVPMHPELVRILRGWKELCPKHEGLVFPVQPEKPGEFRMGNRFDNLGLTEGLTAAGCHQPADGKPWHLLRHTFASHFVMSGGSLFTLQRLLGHAQATTTQRYAHLAPDYLAAEVARMTFAQPTPEGVADLGEARRRRAVEQTRE